MVRQIDRGYARYPGMEADRSMGTSKIILDVKELREQFALQIGRFDPLCEMADYLFDQLVMNALNVQGQLMREPRASLGRLIRSDDPQAVENLLDRTWVNISSLASYMERNNAGRPGAMQPSCQIPGRFVGDTVTLYYDPVYEDYMAAMDEALTDAVEQPLCEEELAEQQQEEDLEYILEQQGIVTNPADLPWDAQGVPDYMNHQAVRGFHPIIGESEQKSDDLLGVSSRKF